MASQTPSSRYAVLLPALIAFLGALVGASVAGYITLIAQDNQFEARRLDQTRAKRERVYTRFINAADRYGTESVAFYEACVVSIGDAVERRVSQRAEPDLTENALSREITELVARKREEACDSVRVNNARYDYQGAINALYIYGSEAAIEAEGELSRSLPGSLTGLSGGIQVTPVSEADFHRAYKGFQTVMCQELPADPRSDC